MILKKILIIGFSCLLTSSVFAQGTAFITGPQLSVEKVLDNIKTELQKQVGLDQNLLSQWENLSLGNIVSSQLKTLQSSAISKGRQMSDSLWNAINGKKPNGSSASSGGKTSGGRSSASSSSGGTSNSSTASSSASSTGTASSGKPNTGTTTAVANSTSSAAQEATQAASSTTTTTTSGVVDGSSLMEVNGSTNYGNLEKYKNAEQNKKLIQQNLQFKAGRTSSVGDFNTIVQNLENAIKSTATNSTAVSLVHQATAPKYLDWVEEAEKQLETAQDERTAIQWNSFITISGLDFWNKLLITKSGALNLEGILANQKAGSQF